MFLVLLRIILFFVLVRFAVKLYRAVTRRSEARPRVHTHRPAEGDRVSGGRVVDVDFTENPHRKEAEKHRR